MEPLELHDRHESLDAAFIEVNGMEVVQRYGDGTAEYPALRNAVGVMDLSYRSRVCLAGNDRIRFLNGQVTNNIKALHPGEGCYAALVTAKGRMESDLHVHCLQDELLLDFEPGLNSNVSQRLQKYLVADDVEVVDLRPHYGLLSVQGPKAEGVVLQLELDVTLHKNAYQSCVVNAPTLGEIVMVNLPRFDLPGFDLFVPTAALGTVMDRLMAAAKAVGGGACGWEAMEAARIEAGLPRYGHDMDEAIIPLEAGLEDRAVRYNKGCYIGQEVINRIHSIGQVTKSLRGLLLPDDLAHLPSHGDKLLQESREVGYITSSLRSARFKRGIAMGYVRKEVNQPGTTLTLVTPQASVPVVVVALPFSEGLP
jgi:aminomethyltransferase